jgi:hypothetical protein
MPNNDITTAMPGVARFWLTIFLLVATGVTAYGILSLWAPAQSPGQVPAKNCAQNSNPDLSNIYPDRVDTGSAVPVLLIGCAFPKDTQVKFNGVIHGSSWVDDSHIRLDLTTADVAVANIVKITLSSKDTDYGNGVIAISPAVISWNFFGLHFAGISQELQLLLLVIFSGALGSSVYAIKSLADYRGAGKLYSVWYIFYFVQPVEGAGIALIFYFAIRGGFLAGTGADVKAVNPFGICAVAALAGAFSDMAFGKLREVFETLFKPTDDRPGKIEAPKITTTSLPDGMVGTEYKQKLAETGGVAPLKFSVSPTLPDGLTLDETTGTISGTPTAVKDKTPYTFKVTDSAKPANVATKEITLEIKPAGSAPATATPATPVETPPPIQPQPVL